MEYKGWKLVGYRILEGLTLLWIFFVFGLMLYLGNVQVKRFYLSMVLISKGTEVVGFNNIPFPTTSIILK